MTSVDRARAPLAEQRHALILAEVSRNGAARVSDFTTLLAVSEMTIRRDLDALAKRGLLTKVHGGATVVASGKSDEPGFEAKSSREQPEKQLIAERAAALVQPNTAIGLTGGTTTWALAAQLVDVPRLTVVTNSLRVAEVLHASTRSDQVVILTGGVRTPSDALVGPVAEATIRSLHVDLVFMGVHGIDAVAGLTTPNVGEAETNRAFAASAGRLIAVADHTKWGCMGLSQILPLREVDTWVVDELPADAAPLLKEHAPRLTVVTARRPPRGSESRRMP